MDIVLPPQLDPAQRPNREAIVRQRERLLQAGSRVPLPEDVAYVFIVFTQRSGSFYFAELLTTTGFFNQAQEDLAAGAVAAGCRQHGLDSFTDYFAHLVRSAARNGFFLSKVTIRELIALAWQGVLPRILERSRFILVERIDKLAQAISWSIADQTNVYTAFKDAPDVPDGRERLVYDGPDLRRRVESIVKQHANVEMFMVLNGLVPLHLTYERLAADPVGCGRDACTYLGWPDLVCDPAMVRLRRQATGLNAEWRERFLSAPR